jgi:hypothetical protein
MDRMSDYRSANGVKGTAELAYRRVKDKFWSFEEMEIPHSNDPIRIIRCCWIFVV